MSVSVFGSQPKGLVAFADNGGGGDDFRLLEHVGKVAVFEVQGPESVTTQYGDKTAIRANVTVVGGGTYTDVLIFNSAPVDQLKGSTGQKVVAAIEEYKGMGGKGAAAPRLVAPSAEQLKAAESALGEAPF